MGWCLSVLPRAAVARLSLDMYIGPRLRLSRLDLGLDRRHRVWCEAPPACSDTGTAKHLAHVDQASRLGQI